jgi:hypothetical protein
LIGFLRSIEVIPGAESVIPSEVEDLIGRFAAYLLTERGLAVGTVVNYVHAARLFLGSLQPPASEDLGRLQAGDVQRFLLKEFPQRSIASAKSVVGGVKALLRFFYVEGITPLSLAGAVPTVSGWSKTWLPRGGARQFSNGIAGQLQHDHGSGVPGLRSAVAAGPDGQACRRGRRARGRRRRLACR